MSTFSLTAMNPNRENLVEQETLFAVEHQFSFCPKCHDLMATPLIARSKDLEHDIGGCFKGEAICQPCGWYEGKYGAAIEHYAGQWGIEDPYRSWKEICYEIGDDLWNCDALQEQRMIYRRRVYSCIAAAHRQAAEEVAALEPVEIPRELPWTWLKGRR